MTFDEAWEPSVTAQEVIVADEDDWMGLLDQYGEPVMRQKIKMGFHGKN